jgi:hypothetical protein
MITGLGNISITTEQFDIDVLLDRAAEHLAAEKLGQALADRLAYGQPQTIILHGDEFGVQYALPVTAAKLPVKVHAEIAKGNTVRVVTLKPDRRASLRELVALNQEFGVQVGEGQ